MNTSTCTFIAASTACLFRAFFVLAYLPAFHAPNVPTHHCHGGGDVPSLMCMPRRPHMMLRRCDDVPSMLIQFQ